MNDELMTVIEEVDVLVAEIRELHSHGPHFRVFHRFHEPSTDCAPGEEILAVCLVHSGGEVYLHLSLALRILFDYLARHSRLPQSATQIAAGIRADLFYTEHATNASGLGSFTRSIPRSYVRVYVERLESALEGAFIEAGLPMKVHVVLIHQETVMNEVGYRLRGSFEWIHIDI